MGIVDQDWLPAAVRCSVVPVEEAEIRKGLLKYGGQTYVVREIRVKNFNTGKTLDTPVFSWIQARERRTETYAFFLAEIPLGYKGVADLRIEDGRIVLVERETGKTFAIKSALLR